MFIHLKAGIEQIERNTKEIPRTHNCIKGKIMDKETKVGLMAMVFMVTLAIVVPILVTTSSSW